MTVTALVSGGKDSVYAAYLADCQGWPVDELVTIAPDDAEAMMFHTPNLDMVELQARAWGKDRRRVPVRGTGEEAELAALRHALEGDRGPVVAGAIQSSYQWSRLLRVADGLGRRVYVPLWRKDPGRVVREEIDAGLDIRLVHLAAEPLTSELLGQRLDLPLLTELERRAKEIRPVNVAGEGGEFETLVVDAPFFSSRLVLDEAESLVRGTTATLRVTKAHLDSKKGAPRP